MARRQQEKGLFLDALSLSHTHTSPQNAGCYGHTIRSTRRNSRNKAPVSVHYHDQRSGWDGWGLGRSHTFLADDQEKPRKLCLTYHPGLRVLVSRDSSSSSSSPHPLFFFSTGHTSLLLNVYSPILAPFPFPLPLPLLPLVLHPQKPWFPSRHCSCCLLRSSALRLPETVLHFSSKPRLPRGKDFSAKSPSKAMWMLAPSCRTLPSSRATILKSCSRDTRRWNGLLISRHSTVSRMVNTAIRSSC